MVLYYPIKLCHVPLMHTRTREKNVLHIIWPHRWYVTKLLKRPLFINLNALIFYWINLQGT